MVKREAGSILSGLMKKRLSAGKEAALTPLSSFTVKWTSLIAPRISSIRPMRCLLSR